MAPVPSPLLRGAAVGLALLLAAGCAGNGEDSAGTTTTGPTTTLPQPSTTTTLPPRAVTEVDVCSLLREVDLERVLDDAGPGEPAPVDERDPAEGVPAFVTGACSWPTRDDPALSLHYLAPTTAPDAPQHLRDVLDAGTAFAEGGRVTTQDVGNQTVGILLDAEERIREVAVVKRSALLYLLVEDEVDARQPGALTDYAEILLAALVRAPR